MFCSLINSRTHLKRMARVDRARNETERQEISPLDVCSRSSADRLSARRRQTNLSIVGKDDSLLDRSMSLSSDPTGLDDMDMNDNAPNQAEKRAHHNALERKRRDHIKGSFGDLRDVIPLLKGEKVNDALSLVALDSSS